MSLRALAVLFTIIVVTAGPRPRSSGAGEPERALRIGYLLVGSDLDNPRAVLLELRESLLADSRVRQALAAAGFSATEITLQSCEVFQDMLQALEARQLELAFATPVIYGRLFHPLTDDPTRLEPRGYEPILQFYKPASDVVGGVGGGVTRQGVVFIGRGSPLWGKDELDDEDRRRAIENRRVAFTDTWSAASYIYPQLRMAQLFNGARPPLDPVLRRGSSAEVVKAVVSGLLEIGACDEQALRRWGTIGGEERFKILLRTTPLPTDPILIEGGLVPEDSELGAELKIALRRFFSGQDAGGVPPVPGLNVENTSRRAFEDIAAKLKKWDALSTRPPGLD